MTPIKDGKMIPLETKIMNSENKILEWHDFHKGNTYVSFSGGKDSTVLLHMVRSLFPETPAVFCDTGLEYPEIRSFVKGFDNVAWIKPTMKFKDVIDKYGYPLISKEVSQKINEIRRTGSEKLRNKRMYGDENGNGKVPDKWKFLIHAPFEISNKCCDVMKKRPFEIYHKETGRFPYVGVMACESTLRSQSWHKYGCNAFDINNMASRPLMPWIEEDIQEYIKEFNIEISDIYSMGYERTGCMFCGFGVHHDKDDRFRRMQGTHPKQYKYIMDELGFKKVLEYVYHRGNPEENLFGGSYGIY